MLKFGCSLMTDGINIFVKVQKKSWRKLPRIFLLFRLISFFWGGDGMIYLYSGTPGSGKSYHAMVDILHKLRRKSRNRVIANFAVKVPGSAADRFEYWDDNDISVARLCQYAAEHHVRGIEGQCLLVIDEAECIFNSRDWNGRGVIRSALKRNPDTRMDWIKFFSQHRKFGYNVILISQSDKMIDKQIRALIEYDVKHVKMRNGFFFWLPLGFLCVEKWYGQNMKLGTQILWYHKRIAERYDSYAMFDALAAEDASAQGEPRSGGSPCADEGPSAHDAASPAVSAEVGADPAPAYQNERREPLAARLLTAVRRRWNLSRFAIASRLRHAARKAADLLHLRTRSKDNEGQP